MAAPSPTPLSIQSAASLQNQLLSMMTQAITIARYDAGSDSYVPIGTINAYVTTPKLLKPAPEEAFTLTVALDADAQIGDRFDFDDWTWHITDRSTRYTSGIPVAITLLAARITPVANPAAPPSAGGNSVFTPNALIDVRRDGVTSLSNVSAEFTTPTAGAVLPTGEPITYVVLVPIATDIDINDVLVLTEYAQTVLAVADILIVRARMWQGSAPNALRRLLVQDTAIGGF